MVPARIPLSDPDRTLFDPDPTTYLTGGTQLNNATVKINIALYGSGNVHILALAGYIPQHFPRYAQLALAAVNIARHGIPIDPARATPAPAGNRDTGE